MKKIFRIFSIAALCSLAFTNQSSAQSYGVGSNVANLGIGFGYSINYGISGTSTPVLHGSFEHGLQELGPGILGVGAAFSYQSSQWKYNDGYGTTIDYKWRTMFFAARASWHPDFLIGDKYDVYGALQLGFYNFNYDYKVTGPNTYNYYYSNPLKSRVGLGLVAGGRYYFTDNIGVFLEVGYDISYSKFGLALKF